jgi:hypothetical protein
MRINEPGAPPSEKYLSNESDRQGASFSLTEYGENICYLSGNWSEISAGM